MGHYDKRQEDLEKLGFKHYRAYLNSGLWRGIRKAAFARSKGKCHMCLKAKPAQIHHTRYDLPILRGDPGCLEYLVALCKYCHRNIEFTAGRKNTLEQANAILSGRKMPMGRSYPKKPRRPKKPSKP